MALEFLSWDTVQILNEIKSRYKTESGQELEIGSNEMAIAATISYIMGVQKDMFNEKASQRFLQTASGEYLDAHAANFGIYERPTNYKARCVVRVENLTGSNISVQESLLRIADDNGHIFKPCFDEIVRPVGSPGPSSFLFESVTSDKGNDGIPVGALCNVISPEYEGRLGVTNLSITDGADPEPFPYSVEGDNKFRAYVMSIFQGTSAAGSSATYKRIILGVDERIKDVYILKSGDAGFQRGSIKVYWTTDSESVLGSGEQQYGITSAIYNALQNALNRPINDYIEYPEFASVTYSVVDYRAKYDQSKYDASAFVQPILDKAKREYCDYLRSNLGHPFSMTELFYFVRKQENGDCVDYLYTDSFSPEYVECSKWQVALGFDDLTLTA